jgi:hypothetical protein
MRTDMQVEPVTVPHQVRLTPVRPDITLTEVIRLAGREGTVTVMHTGHMRTDITTAPRLCDA